MIVQERKHRYGLIGLTLLLSGCLLSFHASAAQDGEEYPDVLIDRGVLDALTGSDDTEARPFFPTLTIPESGSDAPPLPAEMKSEADGTFAPRPGRKPERRKEAVADSRVAPRPVKRPAIQKASKSFVQKARREAQVRTRVKRVDAERISRTDVAPVRNTVLPKFPKMPAVPAGRVMAESLRPLPGLAAGGLDSELKADRLRVPDREALVTAIDAISRRKPARPLSSKASKGNDKGKPAFAAVEPAAGDVKQKVSEPKVIDITEEIPPPPPPAGMGGKADGRQVPRPPPPEKKELQFISLPCCKGREGEIDGEMKASLDSSILPLLAGNPAWQLQLQSFADGKSDRPGGAKTISLVRAMAVREWLMNRGVAASRIDIRALGAETDRDPPDRMDFIFMEPM